MTELELKEAVLAKCEEYEYSAFEGLHIRKLDVSYKDGYRIFAYDDSLDIKVSTDFPADHPIWKIASMSLAIKQPEPPSPSDALLWEAFDLFEVMLDSPVTKDRRAMFAEWLATLPIDPFKADQELVSQAFEREDLERDLLNECYNYNLINAIKRLAGMEVQNG